MSDRRSFLGGLLLGSAGLAASVAGEKIEVARKIIVGNADLANALSSAKDGEIVAATVDDMSRAGLSIGGGNNFGDTSWFGVPHQLIHKMTMKEHNSWLHDHLEVNRKYGYGFRMYQDLAESWQR